MVFLDMPSGLQRGELAGLKWEDFDFKNLHVSVTWSLVDQHVGPLKTEASRRLMPIDEYGTHDLLAWYELTSYKGPFRLRMVDRCQSRWSQARKTASLAEQRHAPLHPARCTKGGNQQENVVAYFSSHIFDLAQGQRGGRQNRAGAVEAFSCQDDPGHLPPSAKFAKAGSAEQSGRHDRPKLSCTVVVPRVSRGKRPELIEKIWRPRRDLDPCYRRERADLA